MWKRTELLTSSTEADLALTSHSSIAEALPSPPFLLPPRFSLLAMAGIQDLPPEILYHILELGTSELYPEIDYRRTALVARAWKEPSQQFLHFITWRPNLKWETALICTSGSIPLASSP